MRRSFLLAATSIAVKGLICLPSHTSERTRRSAPCSIMNSTMRYCSGAAVATFAVSRNIRVISMGLLSSIALLSAAHEQCVFSVTLAAAGNLSCDWPPQGMSLP